MYLQTDCAQSAPKRSLSLVCPCRQDRSSRTAPVHQAADIAAFRRKRPGFDGPDPLQAVVSTSMSGSAFALRL